MITGTDHSAVLQHQNQIRMAQTADTLGNENGGGITVMLPKGVAQIGIGLIVQCGGESEFPDPRPGHGQ